MRFVVLHHVPPPSSERAEHWDLLLDTSGSLRTWALSAAPRAGATIAATPLGDHRRVFLVYEGPLTGGRGFVTRYDEGECEIVREDATRVMLQMNGRLCVGPLTVVLESKTKG